MDEEVAKFDPDEFNPWNVTSVEEFLFYNCPECDMKHTSRDVFINHALLEHPKVMFSSTVFQNPSKNLILQTLRAKRALNQKINTEKTIIFGL